MVLYLKFYTLKGSYGGIAMCQIVPALATVQFRMVIPYSTIRSFPPYFLLSKLKTNDEAENKTKEVNKILLNALQMHRLKSRSVRANLVSWNTKAAESRIRLAEILPKNQYTNKISMRNH